MGHISHKLQFMDAYMDQNAMFFSSLNFNGLFCYEEGKAEVEFLGHFPGEPIEKKKLHRQIIAQKNKLYFIPCQGNGVSIYDRKTRNFSYVRMEEKGETVISRAFLLKNNILLVPSDLRVPFILLHTWNDTYELLDELHTVVQLCLSGTEIMETDVYGAYVIKGNLYLAIGGSNKVLCINLSSGQADIYELPKPYKIKNLYFEQDKFYFTLQDRSMVVRWGCKTKECREYIFPEGCEANLHPYMTVFRWKSHLLLMPCAANKIWEFNEKEDKWYERCEYIPEGFQRVLREKSLFLGYKCMDDKLYLFPRAGNGMICISETQSRLLEFFCSEQMEEKMREIQGTYMEGLVSRNVLLYEGIDDIHLEDMLFSGLNNLKKKEAGEDSDIGKRIWDYYSGLEKNK